MRDTLSKYMELAKNMFSQYKREILIGLAIFVFLFVALAAVKLFFPLIVVGLLGTAAYYAYKAYRTRLPKPASE